MQKWAKYLLTSIQDCQSPVNLMGLVWNNKKMLNKKLFVCTGNVILEVVVDPEIVIGQDHDQGKERRRRNVKVEIDHTAEVEVGNVELETGPIVEVEVGNERRTDTETDLEIERGIKARESEIEVMKCLLKWKLERYLHCLVQII